jgi:hypothetical protein
LTPTSKSMPGGSKTDKKKKGSWYTVSTV